MSSKAAKRRKKSERNSVRSMQAEWQAQEVKVTKAAPEDPCRVVLSTRCRQLGIRDNRTGRASVSWPGIEHPVGRALFFGVSCARERSDLWALFSDMDAVHETYHRRIMGRARFPMCTKVEFLPETLEVRDDDRPDLRTDDEKNRAAQEGWQALLIQIGKLNARYRPLMMSALWREVIPLEGGKLTAQGILLIEGLRALLQIRSGA